MDLEEGVLEVGSRGLLLENELSQLQEALNVPVKTITELASALTCAAILGSGVVESTISLFELYFLFVFLFVYAVIVVSRCLCVTVVRSLI